MSKKNRLIIAGSALALLFAVAAYMFFSGDSHAAEATDAQNLEAVHQAEKTAQAASPPPVKFNDIPAEMPTNGRRTQTK